MQNALRTLKIFLPANTSHTRDFINQKVDMVLAIPDFSDIDRELFIKVVETEYNIRVDDWTTLEKREGRLPWLTRRRADIKWDFWQRYAGYLEDYKGFAPGTLRQLDRLTDAIVDKLFDPTVPNVRIDKRGLVVGQVQSGKTSNYTGLICKAVDAGYKLIVVLAGIHNNLRAQTQLRLDEGFLGFDTLTTRNYFEANTAFGVSQVKKGLIAHSVTSSSQDGDFSAPAFNSLGLNFDTNEPIILVVKKNARVLGRLLTWLKAKGQIDADGNRYIASKSLLLIDDEADHASINVNKDQNKPTRINGQIREVLRLFYKSAYVGYTATPFANIFIPIEDDQLFPRDFIINLPPPSNYIGPERVFGFQPLQDDDTLTDTLPIVHRIDDTAAFMPEKEREAPPPGDLPNSLKRAIRCFLLVCAIRRQRGQTRDHNSMLIHVTRYNKRQEKLTELVDEAFAYYKRGIDQNDPTVLELMRQTFEEDAPDYSSFTTTTQRILDSPLLRTLDPVVRVHTWAEVLPHLHPAMARVKVREINGRSGDVLDYYEEKEGLSVIAVGGDKLSRGLTLEGLSVSYFLRPSKMYDTLMQMGRWFGYRPGYPDLCRLFTSTELNKWFCHITLASEELRAEFNYMAANRRSPDEYALKVRTHPGGLQITAANRMKNTVQMTFSFAGRLVETYVFDRYTDTIAANLEHTQQFVASLGPNNRRATGESYVWDNVTAGQVIDFLNGYRVAKSLYRADSQALARFIDAQLQNKDPELTTWTLALMSRQKPERTTPYTIAGKTVVIGQISRSSEPNNSNADEYYLRKSHIISPRHEFIDLNPDQEEKAKRLTAISRTATAIRKEHADTPIPELDGLTGDALDEGIQTLAAQRVEQGTGVVPDYPNGEIVRNKIRDRSRSLLLLYSLDPVEASLPPDSPAIVGYAISFPASNYNNPVSYAVHSQLAAFLNTQDTIDDEPDADED